jgi:hypothetical protein
MSDGPGTRRRVRLPVHVAVTVCASCAAYAGSLALVTALEAGRQEATTIAAEPIADVAARTQAANDGLAAQLAATSVRYEAAAAAYRALEPADAASAAALAALRARLSSLSRDLGAITLPALPPRSALTAVSVSGPAAVPAAAHATTGGSGKP